MVDRVAKKLEGACDECRRGAQWEKRGHVVGIGVGPLYMAQVCDMSCTRRSWFRLGSTFQVCNDRGESGDQSCAGGVVVEVRVLWVICICKGLESMLVPVR